MQLNLRNPLVFFDLETTGINIVKDRIVEISYVKVFPNGKEETKTPDKSRYAYSPRIYRYSWHNR